MTKKELKQLLSDVVNISLGAGKLIMNYYETDYSVEYKDDNSPLTLADKASNNYITEKLEEYNIPILSEEGKHLTYDERKKWERLWLVDPLDGTKEFIKKNGEFTINIALIENNKPIFGVMYAPAINELYFGATEIGGFKITDINPDNNYASFEQLVYFSVKLPIAPPTSQPYTVVASRSHQNKETANYIETLRAKYQNLNVVSRGSALKLGLVADGSADEYPRFGPTMEWDTAAGHAIINSVGYKVMEYGKETELIYNKENLLNPFFHVVK